ncbi:MAG: hypothetical protein H7A19_05390 [Rhodanobacteraceae bacterium]|nr:hypothetical protein [Rhodanobacteraceae bacterium]
MAKTGYLCLMLDALGNLAEVKVASTLEHGAKIGRPTSPIVREQLRRMVLARAVDEQHQLEKGQRESLRKYDILDKDLKLDISKVRVGQKGTYFDAPSKIDALLRAATPSAQLNTKPPKAGSFGHIEEILHSLISNSGVGMARLMGIATGKATGVTDELRSAIALEMARFYRKRRRLGRAQFLLDHYAKRSTDRCFTYRYRLEKGWLDILSNDSKVRQKGLVGLLAEELLGLAHLARDSGHLLTVADLYNLSALCVADTNVCFSQKLSHFDNAVYWSCLTGHIDRLEGALYNRDAALARDAVSRDASKARNEIEQLVTRTLAITGNFTHIEHARTLGLLSQIEYISHHYSATVLNDFLALAEDERLIEGEPSIPRVEFLGAVLCYARIAGLRDTENLSRSLLMAESKLEKWRDGQPCGTADIRDLLAFNYRIEKELHTF